MHSNSQLEKKNSMHSNSQAKSSRKIIVLNLLFQSKMLVKRSRRVATLQKTSTHHFTNFSIKDNSGRQLSADYAVCYIDGTPYMLSKSRGNERQLVICDNYINNGDPVFLGISNHHQVSLFGGYDHPMSLSRLKICALL